MPSTKIEIGTMASARTDHDGDRQSDDRAHAGRAETHQEIRRTQQTPFRCRDGRQPGKVVSRNSAGPRQRLPAQQRQRNAERALGDGEQVHGRLRLDREADVRRRDHLPHQPGAHQRSDRSLEFA